MLNELCTQENRIKKETFRTERVPQEDEDQRCSTRVTQCVCLRRMLEPASVSCVLCVVRARALCLPHINMFLHIRMFYVHFGMFIASTQTPAAFCIYCSHNAMKAPRAVSALHTIARTMATMPRQWRGAREKKVSMFSQN